MAITTKKYCTDWMIIKMIIKTTEKNFCSSAGLYRFYGAREDVRKLLANMVHQHKEKNPDGYCRGTECAEEVDLYKGDALQSYAEYDSPISIPIYSRTSAVFLDDGSKNQNGIRTIRSPIPVAGLHRKASKNTGI